MATWGQFAEQQPELAEAGRGLLYQHGVGLAFLATVRPDGGPRLHPFCPILVGDHLYGILIPSPKLRDLERDDRYALHAFPTEDNEDACYLTGRARRVDDPATRAAVHAQFLAERAHLGQLPPLSDDEGLFEFSVDTCLVTTTTGFGDYQPDHRVWTEA